MDPLSQQSVYPTNTTCPLMVGLELDSSFGAAIVIDGFIGLFSLIWFLILRKRLAEVYEPRVTRYGSVQPAPSNFYKFLYYLILGLNTTERYEIFGLDGVMFLNFLSSALQILVCQLLYGVIILFPIVSCNTGKRDPAWLAMAVGVIFNSAVTMLRFFFDYRKFVLYRVRFNSEARPQHYTVVLSGVSRGMSNEDLKARLNKLRKDEVLYVQRPIHMPELRDLTQERHSLLKHLPRVLKEEARSHDRLLFARWRYCCVLSVLKCMAWANRRHYMPITSEKIVKRLMIVEDKIKELQKQVREDEEKGNWRTDVAFITFRSCSTALWLLTTEGTNAMHHEGIVARPYRPPAPSDVLWRWLFVTRLRRVLRVVLVNTLLSIFYVFMIIPMVLITGLSNITSLSTAAADTLTYAGVSVVDGFIAPLLLLIVLILIVKVLRSAGYREAQYSKVLVENFVMWRIWFFQIFLFVFISTISSIVLQNLSARAGGLVENLALYIPEQVGYFINYMLMLSLVPIPIILARILPAIQALKVRRRNKKKQSSGTSSPPKHSSPTPSISSPAAPVHTAIGIGSPREKIWEDKTSSQSEQGIQSTILFGLHSSIFAINLLFSSISPLFLLFGMLYFAIVFPVTSYLLIFVHEAKDDRGGALWQVVFEQTCGALIIYQVVMIGVFTVVQSFVSVGLTDTNSASHWPV